jgi:Cthe_2314-like HEPN
VNQLLRFLFNEPRRLDSNELVTVQSAINSFRKIIFSGKTRVEIPKERQARIDIWCQGFIDAVNELEQSQYVARKYTNRVNKKFIEQMNIEEVDDYHRFNYFYKNGLIRMFSLLDKLGYFMNEIFNLQTEKMKSKFSYFTVLRNMRGRSSNYKWLEQQLTMLKNQHKATLDKLRNQRNMEIHYINVEMMDELMDENRRGGDRVRLENTQASMADLDAGCHMVMQAMNIVFTYLSRGK